MGALSHIRVLDLGRVLAAPWATQILGDLGAEVIKIEKPGEGDETRHFGPPFLTGGSGGRGDATYFLTANRNKKSVTIDFAKPEGAALVKRLARRAHVVVENFKTGALARYGLDYESLAAENPGLIYCSLTGFGHDGPYKDKAGYDYLIQGMGGLMSVTGQPDGAPGAEPMKVGVAVSDLVTGLYTTIAILAALAPSGAHRRRPVDRHGAVRLPGGGTRQSGDELSGRRHAADPARQCPSQHRALSGVRDRRRPSDPCRRQRPAVRELREGGRCIEALAADPRFATNAERVAHREAPDRSARAGPCAHARWPTGSRVLEAANVPCGPINRIDQVFADPQAIARGLTVAMQHATRRRCDLVASPLRLSADAAGISLRAAASRRAHERNSCAAC